jgi:LEA14-like dessication related protein
MWLLTLAGCQVLSSLPLLRDTVPDVDVAGVDLDTVDFVGIGANVVLDVKNPYPLEVEVDHANWTLSIAGKPLLGGVQTSRMTLPAGGTGQVRVPVALAYANVYAAVSTLLTAAEIPYSFDAQFHFDTALGPLLVPIAYSGTLPVLRPPTIDWQALRLDAFDLYNQVAKVALVLNVIPAPGSPITLESLQYALTFDGVPVASGIAAIAAAERGDQLTLPLDLNLLWMSQSAMSAMVLGTPLTAELKAGLTIGTPFGSVPFEFSRTLRFNTPPEEP